MRAIGKALFLDLDGTIIVTKSGKTFPEHKDDWQLNGNILDKIGLFVDLDFYVMIVSNQGGIELGHVLLNDFRQKLRQVTNEIINATGCPFSRIGSRFDITTNPNSFYRKPNPGMGYDLAQSYILDLSESFMVGDASGKLKSTHNVYMGEDGYWYLANGSPVVMSPYKEIIATGEKAGVLKIFDFSDSDIQFAKKCGMQYMDIRDFLGLKSTDNSQLSLGFLNAQS